MGTKLPSTLLTKYHKLNMIHSRVLGLSLFSITLNQGGISCHNCVKK